jgi:uncharacterized protein
MKNTWSSKLRRTFTSMLPVHATRKGKCINCGACCRLPNKCMFLKHRSNGESYCAIHSIRPINCRKYPRAKHEQLTKRTCGFYFG